MPTPEPLPADAYCDDLRKARVLGQAAGSGSKLEQRAKYLNRAAQLAPPELGVWLAAASQVFAEPGKPDPATKEFVYFEVDKVNAQVSKDCGFEVLVPR